MLIFLLVIAVVGDIFLSIMLWAARVELAHQGESEWLVRRTFMHLREGAPLVGDERYIADNYLGHQIVDAIQHGRVGGDGKVVCHD